jgi:hypothetical protein
MLQPLLDLIYHAVQIGTRRLNVYVVLLDSDLVPARYGSPRSLIAEHLPGVVPNALSGVEVYLGFVGH